MPRRPDGAPATAPGFYATVMRPSVAVFRFNKSPGWQPGDGVWQTLHCAHDSSGSRQGLPIRLIASATVFSPSAGRFPGLPSTVVVGQVAGSA